MLSYEERIKILREKKINHTMQKIEAEGYMDSDDYGTVPLPSDFHFEPIPNHANGGFYGCTALAHNYAALMSIHPVYVDPLEILCGRWAAMLPKYRKGWPDDMYSYAELKPEQKLYNIAPGIGADAHFAADYELGLELGFGGILAKIRKYRDLNPERREFYDAEELCFTAVQGWIQRHIDEIERLLAAQTRPEIRESLTMMLNCNKNVISEAPKTFLEACQWMAWYNCASRIYDRDGAGCHLDKVLYPYYVRDTAAGILNDDLATFILSDLLLVETHYYQLSGSDEQGRDYTNRVSYLVLEAAHWLNASANITIRVHDNIDKDFYYKAIEYLFNDRHGWPRFSGQKALLNYERNKGVTHEMATHRIAVGCHWMAVPGLEYPLNDCIKINVAKVFEIAMDEMMRSGECSMEKLWEIFMAHLGRAVHVTAEGINFQLDHQGDVMPELLMNPLMKNTLEMGLDITKCAELFTMCVDGVALGTVADSFAALEQRIVLEQRCTFEEVYTALKSDFAGNERMRLMLAASERYCGGDPLGDKWALRVSRAFTDTVKAESDLMPGRRQLVPGWFSWSSTIAFGKAVGATPNGRHAGTPVTHGANPTPGFRTDGAATAMSNGIAAIQPNWGNTAPIQIELDPHLSAEEGGIERVAALVKGHIDRGGTLVNINVLDKDTLMAAHKNPMLFPDLVVRVTGFTAYFMALSPEFRQLVVDRFIEGA